MPTKIGGRLIPAIVPGVVHTDLMRAGLIDDPLAGANEAELHWVGEATWRYRTSFAWDDTGHERHDLVFDGLDTIATIVLNDVEIGSTRNQHRVHRFDVRGALRRGQNELVVDFASAPAYLREAAARLGELPKIYPHPFAFLRKAACNFGWDWGPDVITAGIWRPVRLESWSGARIAAVRPTADASGHVRIDVDLEHAGVPGPVSIHAEVAGVAVEVAAEQRAHLQLQVAAPRLWWPRGSGDAHLYELTVRAGDDRWSGNLGFRTIEIDSAPDADGHPFTVVVNGARIPLLGANWIPDDVFPSRLDTTRLERSLHDATESNMNTLRVWGGGVYESDDFYDLCDRLGLLVWQDFLFACAAYPEDEPLWSEVRAEAVDAVNRLAHHPSLMLWNGSNENIWGMTEWGWNATIGDRTWGERYYRELLPAVVAELDPARAYVPSSPFSWASDDQNAPEDGLSHLWDVWNALDYRHYTDTMPRFVSEFGIQGAAAERTLLDALDERPLDPSAGQLAAHQKAIDGLAKMERSFAPHLPPPADVSDWIFTTQLNQAHGLRHAVRGFRSQPISCGGILIWQLNDCWPAVSWSLVDSAGRRKPAWYAVRADFEPVTVILGDRELTFVNDTAIDAESTVTVTRFTLDGMVVATAPIALHAPARSRQRRPLPEIFHATGDAVGIVVLDSPFGRQYRLDREPRESPLTSPRLAVSAASQSGQLLVTVRSDTVCVDLTLRADMLGPDAVVDTALVTLLPSDTHTFVVRGAGPTSIEAIEAALISANDLVTRSVAHETVAASAATAP
ncbi:glycoside hydrolase family 2 protein [Microbacterium sp. W1N]|uniref:glycoside hydrolase family 2 protein n=1 Tax=Microbacterium festucae TaxID=2977531 RepID=UPI0021C0343D|nr:glycoside hydrolase family 2 protein [Microbacterium festucae]MCT9820805.1 glycoside hydrolase family 2 protein [Microbacterium festucae]